MEHAPTIGALCGGRLAKAKGVRYGPPILEMRGLRNQPYRNLGLHLGPEILEIKVKFRN